MVASTGAPALTRMITERGRSSDSTKSRRSLNPRNCGARPSLFARATALSVLSAERL